MMCGSAPLRSFGFEEDDEEEEKEEEEGGQ